MQDFPSMLVVATDTGGRQSSTLGELRMCRSIPTRIPSCHEVGACTTDVTQFCLRSRK